MCCGGKLLMLGQLLLLFCVYSTQCLKVFAASSAGSTTISRGKKSWESNEIGSAISEIGNAFQDEVEKWSHKISVIRSEILPIPLKDFMRLVVDDKAPFSYKRYHESVKDSEVELSRWRIGTDSTMDVSAESPRERELSFFKPVNLPGLASTRGIKRQTYRFFEDIGLILTSSTHLKDVPAADCFSVEDTVVVRALDAKSVRIDISFEVKFVKNTMMKFMIERSTNGEMMQWLKTFGKHLKSISESYRSGHLDLTTASTA
mmetsp:Transcript_8779/g.14599  ORF Transcript_8779/g.14599 Transcript_8779/m.14599 type:complete len:260 (-) Transcript_8779:1182-1961(-)